MAHVMADLARGGHSRELDCDQRRAWIGAARQERDDLVAELGREAQRLYQRILAGKAEFARLPGYRPVCAEPITRSPPPVSPSPVE
jgi:hypothetical protein